MGLGGCGAIEIIGYGCFEAFPSALRLDGERRRAFIREGLGGATAKTLGREVVGVWKSVSGEKGSHIFCHLKGGILLGDSTRKVDEESLQSLTDGVDERPNAQIGDDQRDAKGVVDGDG
jgi:hypothetical protein